MADVHLITIGKIKDKHILALESNYLKRLNTIKVTVHELKAQSENREKEEELILKKLLSFSFKPKIILLTEQGETYNSHKFSNFLFTQFEINSNIALIIGGSSGFGQKILKKASTKLSLSPMTFPHQIARVILIEQLYRAETIYNGHPYHK